MIQSRYYLIIILLLLFTSCIHNNDKSQSDNPYVIKYIELAETESFNENGTIEYKFRLPVFLDDNQKLLNRYVLESVAKYFEIENLKTKDEVLNLEILKSFIVNHTEQLEQDNYETDVEHLEMFKRLEIDSIYTIKDLVVIEEKQESYTGGAHGSYSTNYLVFNVKNKKPLKASDIFDINQLTDIAYDYFLTERGFTKKQFEIEKEVYSFKDNKFHLNDNFSIDSKNVTFLFNPYEIASYAEGQIIVEIPLFKLESTIRKEYKYIINKD